MLKNTFIFYNTIIDNPAKDAVVFRDPVETITCKSPLDVEPCFSRLEHFLSEGYFAAGFLSYELGYHFLDIPFNKASSFPLFSFGIFESVKKLPADKVLSLLSKSSGPDTFRIMNGYYSTPRVNYYQDISRIKDHLEKGNTYQVNYSFKYKFGLSGSPLALFLSLLKRQEVPYASYMDLDEWTILSLSPELFFQRDKDEMLTKPMKGTMERGKTEREDSANTRALADSEKNRAENIMIVDLLRNDMGKISETGSVKTGSLFEIEKYNTLLQMTSTISSRIGKNTGWHSVFKEMFPSGSVTGAPKKRTMEIIKELEQEERNIYTGSMGYITPSGQALFNVAIRTLLINKGTNRAELGIGSGIVYDSDPVKEYDECLLKGLFLTGSGEKEDFSLIETLLWEKGDYFLLERHLKRLETSSERFSFPYDRDKITASLNKTSFCFDSSLKYRVRLTLDRNGSVKITPSDLDSDWPLPVPVTISEKTVPKNDIFSRHKTTNRPLYDQELFAARRSGHFEVLFFNDMGELTEGAITNVVLKQGNGFFTPPLSSGLLGGVYREYLLETGVVPVKEKVLYYEDLRKADKIFLLNSVRKIVPAVLH